MTKLTAMLLLVCAAAFCQERVPLQGRVISGTIIVPGVFVINKATGTETKTDSGGNFTIPSKSGDMLVVYSPKTEVREFAISDASFKEVPYIVEVVISALELKEVVVDGNITSENLGIVPQNQKQYTPAERKLYTAGDFKPIMLLGLLGGGMPLDPVINALNGRTKSLKKQVDLEKREQLLQELHNICTVNEITNNLKIPEEHVDGFLYFVIEDKEVATLMDANNESLAKFRMTELAQHYSERIKQ
jgi:hypothetical protein